PPRTPQVPRGQGAVRGDGAGAFCWQTTGIYFSQLGAGKAGGARWRLPPAKQALSPFWWRPSQERRTATSSLLEGRGEKAAPALRPAPHLLRRLGSTARPEAARPDPSV
uniref:Uncharacterized protein n=1 Tax=Accipiter nisus TaxID=211598 RepID=A0A8B9MLL3_9AVES